jgi:predicted kinase
VALARAAGYALVDLDTATGPLTRVALCACAGDESAIDTPAGDQLRAARYETLLGVAAANLEVGLGVVISAPFTRERSSARHFRDLVGRLRQGNPDLDVALLYIDAPAELVRRRLEARNADRDRAKLARPADQLSPERLIPEARVLDGTGSVAEQLAQALEALAGIGVRSGRPRVDRPQAELC